MSFQPDEKLSVRRGILTNSALLGVQGGIKEQTVVGRGVDDASVIQSVFHVCIGLPDLELQE
jgi:hypothetical protein